VTSESTVYLTVYCPESCASRHPIILPLIILEHWTPSPDPVRSYDLSYLGHLVIREQAVTLCRRGGERFIGVLGHVLQLQPLQLGILITDWSYSLK